MASSTTTSPVSNSRSSDSDALPAPEVDILKTVHFARPVQSAGPFMDALFHNQATIMKMLQEIRLVQAKGIPLDAAQGSRKPRGSLTHGAEVKTLTCNAESTGLLVRLMVMWRDANDKNCFAKSRSNKRLNMVANETYQYITDALNGDPSFLVDVSDEAGRQILDCLQQMRDNETIKEDLHIALAKRVSSMDRIEQQPDPSDTEQEEVVVQKITDSEE